MNWNDLLQPLWLIILIPAAASLLSFLIRPIRRYLAILAAGATGFFVVRMFVDGINNVTAIKLFPGLSIFGIGSNCLQVDYLSAVILALVSGFALLIFIYSFKLQKGDKADWKFFTFGLLTYSAANGALMAGSAVVLYFFWGILLFTVYGMLFYGTKQSPASAKRMFLLNGVADFVLLFGLMVLILYTKQMGLEPGQMSYQGPSARGFFLLNSPLPIISFLCISVGALTKAGSFPMHTWIPKAAETSPAETMAFIPASLDKLLGIYLFIRLCYSLFDIRSNMTIQMIFLVLGAITVLAAVFMALVQKDAMRLLAYHAVSQVGYMILGIATGTILGIAGGLFHMINNAVYKSALFMGAGAVKKQTGEADLQKLGGLAKVMPITFFSFLVAALAISGVPPLNGFVSKWLVYQSFVDLAKMSGNSIYYLFMVAGMFGSVLTLASFLKLTHSMFLGRKPKALNKVKEISFTGWFPPLILALVCIGLGVFAFMFALPKIIYPSLSASVVLTGGLFSPLLFIALVFILLSVGYLIYIMGRAYAPRTRKVFIGAEELTEEEMHYSGAHFYSSIKKIKLFNEFYRFAEGGSFDFYHYIQGLSRALGRTFKQLVDDTLNKLARFVRYFLTLASEGLSRLQTGRLSFYLGWMLFGILILILLLIGLKGGGGA
jgi:formate hydrogenlyase subunit 3/multisubunit Na+/H+ antiporter MnhD subunit